MALDTSGPSRVDFRMPPEGTLQPNGPDDPLPFYYRRLSGGLYRERIRLAVSLLRPPYDAVLELGYGSGVLMPTLAAISRRVCGIDLTSDPRQVQANLARVGVQASLIQGDVRDPHYPDETFDLVLAISIFEHIRDLEPVVRAVWRVLKPSGQLLVGMPRVDRFMERLFPIIGYQNIADVHVTTYRQFLDAATRDGSFRLAKFAKMPGLLPVWAGLYYVMRLEKAPRPR